MPRLPGEEAAINAAKFALNEAKASTEQQYNSFWRKKSDLNAYKNEYKENPSPELKAKISNLESRIQNQKDYLDETQPERVIHDLENSIAAVTNTNSPRF